MQPKTDQQFIGRFFQHLRKKHTKLTYDQAARGAGYTPANISYFENGRWQRGNFMMMRDLCALYKLPFGRVIYELDKKMTEWRAAQCR